MKNIVLTLLFVCFASFSAKAQFECGACETEWEYMNVLGEFAHTFGDCAYSINISYRECGDPVRKEVRINSINFPTGCSSSMTDRELMTEAMKIVFNNAHSIFNEPPTTPQDINILTDCCWHRIPSGVGLFYTELIPCVTECCCESEVTVEQDTKSDGSKFFKLSSKLNLTPYNPGMCNPPINDDGCSYICHAVDSISVGENLAQDRATCPDTCSQDWSTPDSYPPFTEDCSPERLYYSKRHCNGVLQFHFGSFIYNAPNPDNCDLDDLIKRYIYLILATELPNYPVPRTVEFILPTCYEKVVYPNDVHLAKVCYWEDNCCKVSYSIIANSPNVIKNNYNIDTLGATVYCGIRAECEYICDDEYLDYELPKLINHDDRDILFETITNIHPNPTDGIIEFKVTTDFTNNLAIEIFDNTGKLLLSDELNNYNNEILYKFDASNLPAGVYMYNIKSGLMKINSGKFIKK